MNVLDALLFGIRDVLYAGSAMPTRSAINVHGAGVTVTDDVANERTDIEIPGAGPGAGLTLTAVKTAYYEASVGELVLVDATAGDITIVAPTNAAGHTDERWGVLRVEPTLPVSHTVTIDADDGVNDEGTRALATARSCCIMRSDGSTWRVESEFLDVSVSDATPQGVGTAAAGTSQALARADHVHAIGYTAVQTAIGAASSPLGLNSQRITGLADPSGSQDAATKAYVDAGASWRTTPDAHDLGVWRMDESSSSFANSGADGTLALAPTGTVSHLDEGGLGTGVYVNGGSGSYVSSGDTTKCQPTALSVWTWVRVRAHNAQFPLPIAKVHDTGGAFADPFFDYVIELYPAGNTGKWLVGANVSGVFKTFDLGGGDRWSIVVDRPHLLAMTYDGTTIRAYMDGLLAGSLGAAGAIGYGGGPIIRGASPVSALYGLDGWLGECRVRDQVMAASEFAEIYRRGMGVWP